MHTILTIGWVRDLPKLSGKQQLAALRSFGIPDRDIIYDGCKADSGRRDNWAWLMRKLRAGDTLAVIRLRTVYAPHGKMSPRKSLFRTLHEIEDHGVSIVEISTSRRTSVARERDMMIADCLDQIARSRTGGDSGRPANEWTAAERAIVERHWFDLRLRTNAEAFAKIKADAKSAGLHRLASMRNSQSLGNKNAFGASGRGKQKPAKKAKR